MAEPLTVSVSIIGLIVPALHGARILLEDLRNIKDAPQTVEALKNHIISIEAALASLQDIPKEDWDAFGGAIADQVEAATHACSKTCHMIRQNLQHWTRRSSSGKLSRLDRANIGVLKQAQTKSMLEQLQGCKITINSVVSIATLYSSIRHSHITEKVEKIISTKQVEIAGAIKTTNEERDNAVMRLEELSIGDGVRQEDEVEEEAREDTIRQISQEQQTLKTLLKILEELLLRAQKDAVLKALDKDRDRPVQVTFASGNSGFQVGISNGNISGITFGAK